jgi:hypothetical protein
MNLEFKYDRFWEAVSGEHDSNLVYEIGIL